MAGEALSTHACLSGEAKKKKLLGKTARLASGDNGIRPVKRSRKALLQGQSIHADSREANGRITARADRCTNGD